MTVRRHICFSLIVSMLLLSFCACSATNAAPVPASAANRKVAEPTEKAMTITALPEDTPLQPEVWCADELLGDISLAINGTLTGGSIGYYWRPLSTLLAHYPTANIRQCTYDGYDYRYVVYLLENGCRLLLFSHNGQSYGFPVYMGEKTLSYADFSSIAVGNDMATVAAIDPAAAMAQDAFEELVGQHDPLSVRQDCQADGGYDPFTSLHFLADGLLVINYQADTTDDGLIFTVSELRWSPDFLLPNDACRYLPPEALPDMPQAYPMAILVRDYPAR